MTDNNVTNEKLFENVDIDTEFGEQIESRVARFASRKYDWDALKFQADYNPVYRRAQVRYLGTGAAGVGSDMNVVPAENFTFSTMCLPAGCEGPMHVHHDVEEVFFCYKGTIKLFLEDGDKRYTTVLNERDLVSVPAGIYRGLNNIGQEEALMFVMLGSGKPQIPTYPDYHPLSKIKRNV
ncbi:cupin domain-containing protein [Glaciecola sp. 33A]|jgi:quercetin dioxygenase-like cupin family protein|uniref:cupin domain-containing protein n=1 Tax=Glaciecola sp. 33A TaxID=2057807 RepID=UPI000C34B29E|nr:cupin domain-containing protein [Glaciecola sp. 33A]PKI03405.1 cupin domain-containing protein [Glaciecola sp. 33A]